MAEDIALTYQTGKVNAGILYDILEQISKLESEIAKRADSVQFGDRGIMFLNQLRHALPETFTREELIAYHGFVVKEIRGERDRLVNEEVEERLSEYVGEIRGFLDKLGK